MSHGSVIISIAIYIFVLEARNPKASGSCSVFYSPSVFVLIHVIASQIAASGSGQGPVLRFNNAKRMSESLLINPSPWSGCLCCVNNYHSCLFSSKLPTFSPLSNTKNSFNFEMAAGNPIGSLEMIGPLQDTHFLLFSIVLMCQSSAH